MKRKTDGHAQLDEFEALLEEHNVRAAERADSVHGRIADLEAELQSLRVLQERLHGARSTHPKKQ